MYHYNITSEDLWHWLPDVSTLCPARQGKSLPWDLLFILKLSYSKPFYITLNNASILNIEEVIEFYNSGNESLKKGFSLILYTISIPSKTPYTMYHCNIAPEDLWHELPDVSTLRPASQDQWAVNFFRDQFAFISADTFNNSVEWQTWGLYGVGDRRFSN